MAKKTASKGTRGRGRPAKKKKAAAPLRGEIAPEQPDTLDLASAAVQWPEFAAQFKTQLAACVADCRGRPLTTAKRSIVLTFDLKPDDGKVIIQPKSRMSMPQSRMEPITLNVGPRNQLLLDFGRDDSVDLLEEDEEEPEELEPSQALDGGSDEFWK